MYIQVQILQLQKKHDVILMLDENEFLYNKASNVLFKTYIPKNHQQPPLVIPPMTDVPATTFLA
jgi:hypothetical protein